MPKIKIQFSNSFPMNIFTDLIEHYGYEDDCYTINYATNTMIIDTSHMSEEKIHTLNQLMDQNLSNNWINEFF